MIMNNLAEYNGSCIDFKNPNNLYQLSDAQKVMKKRYRNEGFKFLILSEYDLAIGRGPQVKFKFPEKNGRGHF